MKTHDVSEEEEEMDKGSLDKIKMALPLNYEKKRLVRSFMLTINSN